MQFDRINFTLTNTTVNSGTTLKVNLTLPRDSGSFFASEDVLTVSIPSDLVSFGPNMTVKTASTAYKFYLVSNTSSSVSIKLSVGVSNLTSISFEFGPFKNPRSTQTIMGVFVSVMDGQQSLKAQSTNATIGGFTADKIAKAYLATESNEIGYFGTKLTLTLVTKNVLPAGGNVRLVVPLWNPKSE